MKNEEYQLVIEAGRSEFHYWRDLWRYRELVLLPGLARHPGALQADRDRHRLERDPTAPYHDRFHHRLRQAGQAAVRRRPYPIMVFAAMLPWQFFANSLSESSNSLIANANMLTKVYFPRLIVPASAVIVSLVDFLISFVILGLLMAWYRFVPTGGCLPCRFSSRWPLLASFGFGLWLSALNVKYRDFRYIVPFIVQFGLYISPVGFSSSIVPEKWRLLYSLNPMVGVIDGFRWAILGGEARIYWPGFLLSTALDAADFLYGGVRYFRKTERICGYYLVKSETKL